MNSLFESFSSPSEKEKNLVKYIEEIQKKFINQIEELRLENEKIKKEKEEYKSKYFEVKECLDIHVKANNNLIESVSKYKENCSSNTFLNKINEYLK